MNLKRLIWGPLLSFAFLIFFVDLIFGVQWFFKNLVVDVDAEVALADAAAGAEKLIFEPKNDLETPIISANSAISVRSNLFQDDDILFSKNPERKLSIASISKLMTALVAVENLDLSKKIQISDKAAHQTNAPEILKAGEKFFSKDLLQVMLIGSDNAASYALSEQIGEDEFIELMNDKAKEIGMSDTSFLNVTGLGLDNFSTAKDLVKLAKYILKKYPFIFRITASPEFDLHTADGQNSRKIINTNKLLNDSPNLKEIIIGGKTGETRTAGGCLLLVLNTPDNQGYLINIILNSTDRFAEMEKIINWTVGI